MMKHCPVCGSNMKSDFCPTCDRHLGDFESIFTYEQTKADLFFEMVGIVAGTIITVVVIPITICKWIRK